VDALVGAGHHGDAARAELRGRTLLHVPAIFAAEATSALHGLVLRGALDATRATAAAAAVRVTRTIQYPFEPFGRRVWELRDNLTVYDAWYVALAEALDVDLVTGDERLLRATGARCAIRLV
jgi:predicted nucleic acid-binding protein